jgi:hypothetical protein
LFIHIAGVLFGGKAGELLMLRAEGCDLTIDQRIRRIEDLATQWQYSYLVLFQSPISARVVIFNEAQVREDLTAVPRQIFVDLNYPHGIAPLEFLSEVGRRWRDTGSVPHEIGLALGYPIKDVLGFMGFDTASCTGTCGWRIFGDRDPSLRRSRQFKHAKRKAEAFLNVSAG